MKRSQSTLTDIPSGGKSAAEVAAIWLARHDRGLSARERSEFAQWQAADPRHAAEFSRLTSAWENFDLAKADPELTAMAQALDDATRSTVQSRGRNYWTWFGALTAAAAVGVLLLRLAGPASQRQEPSAGAQAVASASTAPSPSYQVVPSAARRLSLPDGSVVELHGNSEIQSDFTVGERRVRLVRGEAQFSVSHDATRPFIVSANGVSVRAVGTAFNVRLASADIEVLVTEGKVRVDDAEKGESLLLPSESDSIGTKSAGNASENAQADAEIPVLAAGQRAVIGFEAITGAPVKAAIESIAATEIDRALAWQSTWLVFRRTTLAEAVEAFNQQAPKSGQTNVRLVLGDDSLRLRQIGGTFRVVNVEAFVRLLEQAADVHAERRGENEIVLLPER